MAQDDKVSLHVRIPPELKDEFKEAVSESHWLKDMTHGVEFLIKQFLQADGYTIKPPESDSDSS